MVDTQSSARDGAGRSRWKVLLVLAGVVLVAAVGGLAWFFGGEAPAEVDLDATASAVAGDDAESTVVGVDGIEGEWTVTTEVGEFTVEGTTTATFVGFRVDEVLNSIGSTTAVGRTPDVEGAITVDGTTVVSAEISADLTGIVSDESRREDSIQRALDTSTHPAATFSLSEPIDLGSEVEEGELVSVTARGVLTINGVSNDVDVALDAQVVDELVLVTGSVDVVFADYEVEVPSSQAVLSVEDHGVVEIQLWLNR